MGEDIQTRCDVAGDPVPEHLPDFVESHGTTGVRQLTLRFGIVKV
jgi:hypothetical protein